MIQFGKIYFPALSHFVQIPPNVLGNKVVQIVTENNWGHYVVLPDPAPPSTVPRGKDPQDLVSITLVDVFLFYYFTHFQMWQIVTCTFAYAICFG